jgi:hypothetical protein
MSAARFTATAASVRTFRHYPEELTRQSQRLIHLALVVLG